MTVMPADHIVALRRDSNRIALGVAGRLNHFVYRAELQCFGGREVRTLQQPRQRLLHPDQPRQTLRAAGARQQADFHLGQPHDDAGSIHEQPIVTRQTQLEGACLRRNNSQYLARKQLVLKWKSNVRTCHHLKHPKNQYHTNNEGAHPQRPF